ncbi:MAG: hypothetical protein COA86_01495 [Kangiella sp.]|nr:MAG: hypothetical protein COA86_01495 [Kangiella sp.]
MDVKIALKQYLVLLTSVAFIGLPAIASSYAEDKRDVAVPGSLPPETIQNQVRPLLNEVRNAQQNKDLQGIKDNVDDILEHLGDWAGNPDIAPIYFSPIESTTPSRKPVGMLWHSINDGIHNKVMWRFVPDGNPEKMRRGLRAAARPVLTYSLLYSLNTYKQQKHLNIVIKGANYLLGLQQENGLFPLPDMRGKDKRQTAIINRILRNNPQAVKDGWIVSDHRGELLFDHSTAGVAMVEAYRITKDQRYFDSAKKASLWAMSQAIDTNWSNNAFAAWLLAEFYSISAQEIMIKSAIDNIRYGVLPGLLESGRWLDPFNSKLIYHSINVRGMLAVLRQLPKEDSFREELVTQIKKAIDNASRQITSYGASSVSTSTEMLIDGLEELGFNQKWIDALNININATLKQLQNIRVSDVGVYLPKYMRYIENQNQKKSK